MDRIYRRIAKDLLDAAVTGKLRGGDWLPRISDIAARYACSATVAREAIRALEERRVVEVHRSRGQRVLDADHWHHLDHDVATALLVHHPTRRTLREAVDALQVIETRGALQAAERAKDGDLALLDSELARMRTSSSRANGAGGSGSRFSEAEAEFHRTLMLLSGNRFLADMQRQLHPVLAMVRRRRAADRDLMAIDLHERIVAAMRAADPAATAAAVEDYCRHLASWLRA